jgi:hypothetical protein
MQLRIIFWLGAASLLLAAGAAGCGSTGKPARADKARVTLHDYRNGQRFELVGESHTDRVTYYSEVRTDAARKIQTDDAMAALLEHMDGKGLARYLKEGRAPRSAHQQLARAFEIERDGLTYHWAVGQRSSADERLAFNECVQPFLQLYNISTGFQTVENPRGPALFEEAGASSRSSGGL